MKELTSSESARSNAPNDWYAIDWQRVERNVRGIQTRITKATQEGKWRRVKALQRLLTRSFCGKALAVRRVTENQGSRTSGADRELWESPETRMGFDFLGWNFRKYTGTLLIKPSTKNAQAFYRKAKELVSGHKTVRQEELIRMLNPLLRGWANYHRPVVAKAAYVRMDHLLFKAIWRWAKRRHPKKKALWIRKKYFRSEGKRKCLEIGM